MDNKCSGMESAAELLTEAKEYYEQSVDLIQRAYQAIVLDTTKISSEGFLGQTAANCKGLAIRDIVLLLEVLDPQNVTQKITSAGDNLRNAKRVFIGQQAGIERAKENGENKNDVVDPRSSSGSSPDSNRDSVLSKPEAERDQ